MRSWLRLCTAAVFGLITSCSNVPSLSDSLRDADRLAAEGRAAEAIARLHSIVASGHDDPQLRLRLARQYLIVGQPAEALSNLDRGERLGLPIAQTDEIRVMALLALRRFDAAREILESRADNVSSIRLPLLRGATALGLGHPAEVLDLVAMPTRLSAAEASAVDAEAVLLRVQALIELGRVREAIAELRAGSELVVHDPRISVTLAELLLKDGDIKAATSVVDDCLQRSTKIPEQRRPAWRGAILPLAVDLQLAGGNAQSARRLFAELQALAPDARVTRLLGAKMAGIEGRAADSIGTLQALIAADSNDIDARLMLAAALTETGRLNQAQSQLDWILSRQPDNRVARVLLARAMLLQGRIDSASATLESIPNDPLSEALLGKIKIQLGEDAAGINLLRSSLERDPDNATLRLDLVEALVATGDYQRAQDALSSLDQPREVDTRQRWNRLRFITSALQARPGQLGTIIERLVAEAPDDLNLRLLAASLYLRPLGNIVMARRHLAEAGRRHSRSVAVALAVGRLESMTGNTSAARDALLRALEIEPRNTTALAGLASMAVTSGDVAGAAAWISELSRIDGPRAKLQALRLHLARGDLAAAKRSEESLLAGSTESTVTMYSIAEAYLAAGRARTAETWARKAVDARPDVPEYWLLLSRAQALLADRTGARHSVQRALEIRPAWLPASRQSIALYLADQNFAGALTVLDQLRAVGVAARTLQLMRADALLAAGRYRDAASAYAEIGPIARETREFVLRWVSARRAAGIADPLRPLFDYLALEPSDSQIRIALAEQLSQLQQPAAAIKEYRRVLADDSDNVVALNNLAWLLAESGSGKLGDAVSMAKRALALAPNSPEVLDTAGWLLHRAGRSPEALPLLERAVTRRPDDRGIRRRLQEVRAAQRGTQG